MTPYNRQVYLLNPKDLSPETIAVTFAKTSRSPESFREIAAELTEAKSAQFHEKWVVGYGHSSVAEHAVLHLAIENVSRLAVETIESNRLASYTEKSTRYQKWSPDAFYTPQEFAAPKALSLFQKTCTSLMETYSEILPAVRQVVEKQCPCQDHESQDAWERRIRSRYVDVCRYLLPAAALANLGMTANARVLESAIRKMLVHPLEEVQKIGSQIRDAAIMEVPTLVKYAEPGEYQRHAGKLVESYALSIPFPTPQWEDWCTLVSSSPESEERVLAALLFRYSDQPLENCLNIARALSDAGRRRLAENALGGLTKHDVPLRELEYADYTFECIMDQGAYFEVKRHRMMSQSAQPLTIDLGYQTPTLIRHAGAEQKYHSAMQAVEIAYRQLSAVSPTAAAYIVPNAYNRRIVMKMNLREAFHFCGLRSAPNAHFSVRIIAQRIAEEIRKVTPILGSYIPVNPSEQWQAINEENFLHGA